MSARRLASSSSSRRISPSARFRAWRERSRSARASRQRTSSAASPDSESRSSLKTRRVYRLLAVRDGWAAGKLAVPMRSAGTPVYDSSHVGLRVVEEAVDIWRYRHLVLELIRRDIKVRYKRSVLGIGWSMLNPLLQMIAMTWVFSVVIRQDIRNYPVYFLSGYVFWTFFSQATGFAASQTLDAGEMGNRVYLPRSAFVLSAVGGALVNLLLSLVPLLAIVLWSGARIHASWLFLPVSVLIGAGFTCGVGLFIFTLASRFVDVREMYGILLQVWFFLTPVVYAPKLVPPEYSFMVRYNPMTYLVELVRAPLYDGWLPGPNTLLFAVLAALASLVIGWSFYAAKIEEYGTRF